MIPNSNVYGTPQEWHLASYDMPEAYLASWGTNASDYGKLSAGVNESKIKLREVLDQSISYVGMGEESPYSNILTLNSSGQVVTDSRYVTNFFYAYGDPITYDYYIPNNGNAITWDVDTLDNDNYNKDYRPIVSFNPKRLLWHVMVIVSDAKYNGTLYTTGLNSYSASAALQTQYPYLKMAFMYPLVDTSNTDTPHWINTLTEPMHLCINERRNVEGLDFITYNDLKITSGYYRGGILLRGSLEGIGNSFISSSHCVYMLGDRSCIEDSGSGYYIYAELYSLSVEEEILKAAACFCNYFVGTNPWPVDWESTALNSDTVFLGYPDSNGISHGEYTVGADNENNPVWGWGQTKDSDYDYNKIPSEYDNTNHFNTVSIAQFNNYYVMSYNQVRDLAKEVYKALQRKPSDVQTTDYSLDSFLTNSPIDGIISIKRYPVYDIPKSNTAHYITIGNYTSDTISAYTLFNDPTRAFLNFSFSGTKRFDEKFGGSFLDREPYTTAELYIPFCGTVPISVADYIGHIINVKIAIDYKSGSCTAYVLRDSTPLQAANGQIGIDIPVTGISTSQVDSQLLNANLRLKESQRQVQSSSYGFLSSGAGIGTTIFGMGKGTGSMAGAMSMSGAASSLSSFMNTGVNFENAWDNRTVAAYELHHIQTPFKSISAGSPLTAAMGELCCRLTIYRPILSDDYDSSVYAKTVGFACLINGQVRDFTGLTEGAIDLSGINCTDKEKSLIATAFKQGVFLKPTPL